MKALGSEHMAFDQVEERHDGECPWPTWSASVDNADPSPRLEACTLAVERDMHAELVEQDRRQQSWAMKPARRGVERAGGWLIFSQSRQVNSHVPSRSA